jgi:hypothetical protein
MSKECDGRMAAGLLMLQVKEALEKIPNKKEKLLFLEEFEKIFKMFLIEKAL